MLGAVQNDHRICRPARQTRLGHPIHASTREAAHLRAIFEAGESPATLAIAAGVVLAVVGPLAAILILLDFGVAHFW